MSDRPQTELMLLPLSALKARRLSKKHGHAARPGSGPAAETCRSCAHLSGKQLASRYYKCGLMKAFWTGGQGTDVRLLDPACRLWKAP